MNCECGDVVEKVKKYKELTKRGLEKVGLVEGLSEKEKEVAEDFLDMAKRYFEDGKHFEGEGKLLTALAAFSYAHAWLDAGIRAKLFDGKGDDQLFTLP